MIANETGQYVNKTTTGNVSTQDCHLIGFYVNSKNAGTLVLRQGGSNGTVISGTITPDIGFHRYCADIHGILHATIGGTALDVTFFVIYSAYQA